MLLITEAQVRDTLTMPAAVKALRAAFTQHGCGHGAILARGRAAATDPVNGAALMISAMGAVLPGDSARCAGVGVVEGVMGTKVYSTLNGQFQFVITLFSSTTGLPLATLEANELTRLRTAAATAVAADLLARPDAKVLALFGAGTQAQAHAQALLPLRQFERVLVCARSGAAEFAAALEAQHGLPVRVADAQSAARADVIVTCTRATDPLFDGDWVQPGTFVAAVGSSKPTARELDDKLLARASLIAVEWLPAAMAEAGELVRAAAGTIQMSRVAELGSLLAQPHACAVDDIVVYKSVGVGLEDVALAHWVFNRLQGAA